MYNEDFLSYFVCFCFGVIFMCMVGTLVISPIRESRILHSVGIDRIEECHNVHSNWSEIVWMDHKQNRGKQSND